MHQARMSFVCKAKEAEIHPAGNGSEQLNNMCVCLFVCLNRSIGMDLKKWYQLERVVRKL